jgi:hypothetical protein
VEFGRAALLFLRGLVKIPVLLVRKGKQNDEITHLFPLDAWIKPRFGC